jgi:hypothetical protein
MNRPEGTLALQGREEVSSVRSLDTINITLVFEQDVQIIEQKDHMFIKHYGSNNYMSNIL